MFVHRKTTQKQVFLYAATLALLLILGIVSVAQAHQNVTIGDYLVEYGWYSEPAVAGQPNAVVINISPVNQAGDANIDASGLIIQAMFGGQTKALTLQPLGENTPGQFIAPITPMRPGKYTVHLSGTIGTTAFNNDVIPEEVQTTDLVQFPVVDSASAMNTSSASLGLAGWLGIAGIVLGAMGILLGIIALTRKTAKG